MNVDFFARHRSLRWLVPAGIGGTVAVATMLGVFQADATQSTGLPRMTPAALLAEVRSAPATGFSGTVLSRVSLGLPALPSLGTAGADDGSTSLVSLLSGSHTVQVWYGAADEQRVALLGAMDETDIFRSGRQLWTWNSSDRVARHAVLPAAPTPTPDPIASATPTVSPGALASHVLAQVSPTTQVRVRPGRQVADRDVYDLVLTPRAGTTRVASVHISVDASTKLPLAVQVWARGDTRPSIDVAFTSVRFTAPATSYFTFSPPSGATVRPLRIESQLAHLSGGRARVTGSDWSRVVEVDTGRTPDTGRGELGRALTPVSGAWGKGGLLQSSLLSVLVTSRGRVYAGAVDPAALYAAAAAG